MADGDRHGVFGNARAAAAKNSGYAARPDARAQKRSEGFVVGGPRMRSAKGIGEDRSASIN